MLRRLIVELFTVARFALVGLSATGLYFLLSLIFHYGIGMGSFLTHALALFISIVASYFGHFFFTYRKTGNHTYFSSKFVIVTLICIVASTGVQILVDQYMSEAAYSFLAVTLFYPAASFLLHHFWTFIDPKAEE